MSARFTAIPDGRRFNAPEPALFLPNSRASLEIMKFLLALFFMLASAGGASAADAIAAPADAAVPQTAEQVKLSYAPLVKEIAPAVVNIYTRRTVQGRVLNPFMDDPFFAPFFEQFSPMRERVESSLGSGFIVDKDGLVVTNAHVIRDAEEIMAVLSDGREFEAEQVLIDNASDVGLLRLKGNTGDLPVAHLAPSEALEVGDLVIAIGNPFGVGQTVTSGIVSALARSNTDINDYDFFIQTDAAINPGNSGGPLVSMDGGVVGVNSAIYSRSGGSLGIGFAVPAEMVQAVISAEKSGQVSARGVVRPWLGFSAQNITSDIANSMGLDRPRGALVSDVFVGGPADEAGLKRGDVIAAINGRAIRDADELKFRIATIPLGDRAQIKISRDGKEQDITFTASPPPEIPSRDPVTIDGRNPFSGATFINVSPAVIEELGILNMEDGVVVSEVEAGSSAARIGLREGDGIIAIGNKHISSTRQIKGRMEAASAQNRWVITLRRRGRDQTLILR